MIYFFISEALSWLSPDLMPEYVLLQGLEPDVKVEGAVAGVCGFYNFANTCYMNSGLQCLLATPTIVKYFTDSFELDKDCFDIAVLVAKFQPLLRDVWAGDYNLLKPMSFKETLSMAHPQFAGAHQHDCQEFLALLLDTMHEELRQIKGRCLFETFILFPMTFKKESLFIFLKWNSSSVRGIINFWTN